MLETITPRSPAVTAPIPPARVGGYLDLLPLGALIIDQELRIREWNRTMVDWTGISVPQAINVPLTDLFPTVGESRYLYRLADVFTSGLPATFSAAFHRHFLPVPARQGLKCAHMIQETEIRRLPDQKNRALITIQDVSHQYVQLEELKRERLDLIRTRDELAQTNTELLSRNQELHEFTYVASHDLQEPLRSITSLAGWLNEDYPDALDDTGRQYLDHISEAADRMQALIEDLLALSRTGTDTIQQERLDLPQLLSEVFQRVEVAIVEKNAQVVVEEAPPIHGDRRLITQLFQNLIGNALKFCQADRPRIHVTSQQLDGRWVFGVRDNGIGMESQFSERIFKPFQRLHSRSEYEGTGIGLSICKKAVHRHGGEIWVDSRPGHGSHFQFTLPTA
ncbi:MAG: ATP-binding protein [Planctomycetota bacterium]